MSKVCVARQVMWLSLIAMYHLEYHAKINFNHHDKLLDNLLTDQSTCYVTFCDAYNHACLFSGFQYHISVHLKLLNDVLSVLCRNGMTFTWLNAAPLIQMYSSL